MSAGGYQLVDFGHGRKLERFGAYLLDRPAPAAVGVELTDPGAWRTASARYGRGAGGWQPAGALPSSWEVEAAGLAIELRPTLSGGIGLFPEHIAFVGWVELAVGRLAAARGDGEPPALLNLFAHTGLLTLVAARAGARVAHVDASKPAVVWARQNAVRSGLADRPVRWLVDDALGFARRELRRGRRYDGVVLDPPTYGHAPDGDPWRLESGLGALLDAIAGLTAGSPALLLTAHASGLRPADLLDPVRAAFGAETAQSAVVQRLEIEAQDGRRLPAGLALRWPAGRAAP
ncbi:MAG: dependent methyltransferase [Chloroflexi bacterium]|nr:dependent methyltransferase [Chloroflexota bacterium]